MRLLGSRGITVGQLTRGTIVRGNHVTDSFVDGINVQSTATTIVDNTANDNANYGIIAVAGVTDGGGNTARGNRGPAQCLNVVCA